ncbi:MAG: threonylcarbamoyl-AMP synthase [Patescibacteria group bacterium]|nr:threonylcarbamoyl-AMP synthase [Patescibacteria group bacterium]MDE2438420.1 threonylcarbamoyl-AMP synthase [Patescibacteria group bacterium]
MKYVIIKPEHQRILRDECIEVLRGGGVIALPTDTVYGLVADATQTRALDRLFSIKIRDSKKPTAIFVSSLARAEDLVFLRTSDRHILSRVWPGATTVIQLLRDAVPLDSRVTAARGDTRTLALRIPAYPFLLSLLAAYPAPLAQTSANPASQPTATTGEEVVDYFQYGTASPDLVVGVETKLGGIPSTILDGTTTPWTLVREGILSKALSSLIAQGLIERKEK